MSPKTTALQSHYLPKKRGTWPWTEGLGCSEENPTMSYFLQKTADMRTLDVNRPFGTTFDKNNHSVTDRVGRVYATHRRCSLRPSAQLPVSLSLSSTRNMPIYCPFLTENGKYFTFHSKCNCTSSKSVGLTSAPLPLLCVMQDRR